MQPNPNSQLTHNNTYNYSFFYKSHCIDSSILKRAIQCVLGEVPQLSGRGRVLASGSRVADYVLECSNDGVEVATATAPGIR